MTYKDIIVFGIGVAAGAIGMKFYMEKKYAAWREETFENVNIEVVDNPEDVVVSDGDMDEIMEKRDELQNRTAEVYSNSPRTDSKSYKEAQKALKTEEEQTFSEKEIDVMLPNSIRRCNRNISDV